jgi:prepilin-type N-terminal cleavage/methylation domain-containing protein
MNKKGFTLIEVLLAITIIGIITGFVIVQMNGAANATKDTKRKADIDLIKNALISYRSENYSNTPAEDCVIGECTTLPTALQAFLQTLPTDPDASNSYRYVSDGTDCSLYATLSDGSIYRYECATNETSNVFPVDGSCGTDDNGVFDYTYTPVNLCVEGEPSAITGVGPWFWSCAGEDTGNTATCMARLSDVFTCSITSGTCGGVDVFHMYDTAGGHTEMNNQTNYTNKVCCVGGGIAVTNITNSDSCAAGASTILKLYDVTMSHVEKGTENNYTNKICLSATSKTAECTYATSCATGYTELASISDGETSLHSGGGVFATKICCKLTSY